MYDKLAFCAGVWHSNTCVYMFGETLRMVVKLKLGCFFFDYGNLGAIEAESNISCVKKRVLIICECLKLDHTRHSNLDLLFIYIIILQTTQAKSFDFH